MTISIQNVVRKNPPSITAVYWDGSEKSAYAILEWVRRSGSFSGRWSKHNRQLAIEIYNGTYSIIVPGQHWVINQADYNFRVLSIDQFRERYDVVPPVPDNVSEKEKQRVLHNYHNLVRSRSLAMLAGENFDEYDKLKNTELDEGLTFHQARQKAFVKLAAKYPADYQRCRVIIKERQARGPKELFDLYPN